jgi:hypothetical protein
MVTCRLPIPPGDPRKPVGYVFNFNIQWRRFQQVQSPS